MNLPAPGDGARLAATRASWHAVAEHVLASARFRTDGRIGLVVTEDGFSTPVLPSDITAWVSGATLLVSRAGKVARTPITTLRAAAGALGIEPGAPADVYTPTTPLEPDTFLPIDVGAASLAAWFRLGWSVLTELRASAVAEDAPSTPTLWPEHFDVGLDLGDETRGRRGTFGTSPGDAEHPEPYAYVTHWSEVAADPFWNDTAFGGASCAARDLAAAPDAQRALTDFFARGRALLTRAEQ